MVINRQLMNKVMEITLKNMNCQEEEVHGTYQNINHTQNARIERLKQLEGQCKVHSFRPLQFDIVKTLLLIIPLICSFVGLLLLKYFKIVRVRCFYKDCPHEQATYFYIQSIDGHQQIEEVAKQNGQLFVYFKNLKYRFTNSDLVPVGYQFQESFNSLLSGQYRQMGLSENIRSNNEKLFGRNEHIVQIPNYFQYMFDILTKPFFLFQYGICVIFILEKLYLYAGIYLGFSIITTTINYILLYRSFTKIKDMAERETDVVVVRDGKTVTVKNHDLVPGDIVRPVKNEEISYDGILICGQVFVNEASLTGESIPVGKFPAADLDQTKKETAWIVEGSKVLQVREQSRVVVINIGYATRRGRIIRKILTRVPKIPDFFLSGLYFLIQTCIVGIIIFACTVNMMVKNNIIPTFVVYRFLDVLAWSFPPSFPIFFNVANSVSLVRLKWKNIFGTEPEKATEAANIKTFCFDKTGTLTQNEIEVYEIVKLTNEAAHHNITKELKLPENNLIGKLFASCHTTRQTEDELLGDEVDLRMFLHSQYKMSATNDPKIRFIVENGTDKIQVLKINQFQSKFQNMSVLARDVNQNKYYVFVKGAPERIDKNSRVKYNYFETLVSNLSLGGFRTIAYGFKQIEESQVSKYLQSERDIFQKDIVALGLVAFENKLKSDTRETIDKLKESDIEPKMITGDNIFIAVQTGFRAGILKEDQRIVLLQGRKQTKHAQGEYEGTLLFKKDGEIIQDKIKLSSEEYLNSNKLAFAIDNDFLKLKPEPPLIKQIKLFARISPENKSLIVKKFKMQQQANFSLLSCRQRLCGRLRWKVGMCGDGANDLMAIRQADVGIGISDSDASYGACFTISQLADVQFIVRQSKNASQSFVDMIRYFGTISFLKIITSTILASDVTYFNSNQTIYFNFAHSVWLALALVLSSAIDKPTKERPFTNLMSFQNHVIYYANIIFPTIGFFGAYYYFYTTSVFVNNQQPLVTIESGYIGINCYTNTIVWLLINIPLVCNAFTIYKSNPYRCKYYQNIPLMILTLGNLAAAVAYFFTTSKLSKSFALVSIPAYESGICLLIMGVTLIASYIFTEVFMYINSK